MRLVLLTALVVALIVPDAWGQSPSESLVLQDAPAGTAASVESVLDARPGRTPPSALRARLHRGGGGDEQAEANPASTIRWGRFAAVSGGLVAGYTGIYFFERSQWWEGEGAGFHFDSHLNYARNFDKAAHFYAGEVQALLHARLFEWSGLSRNRAALAGALTSLAAQTHVEVHDGYSRQWGFDWFDQAANVLGAGWFYAHERVDALRRFDVRWAYYPSDVWLENLEARQQNNNVFADDYSGHTYWVSMRMHDLLPTSVQRVWPRFLQVSAGASLHDWTDDSWDANRDDRGPDPDAYVSYHVSLDVDWREVIPRSTWLGRTTGDLLNRFHLPFPAVRVWPSLGVHLVFVGQE